MKDNNVKNNNVIADRINSEISQILGFLKLKFSHKSAISESNYHLVLFFIYLFSKKLLEKFLMNHYFKGMSDILYHCAG